mmetsp:Transcript_5814/g.6505  ORF Transcript_5814/g.6505 Transcript_5814/m.6505 type:complete len:81 (-) Transcript_5814:926-1168(-)
MRAVTLISLLLIASSSAFTPSYSNRYVCSSYAYTFLQWCFKNKRNNVMLFWCRHIIFSLCDPPHPFKPTTRGELRSPRLQ